MPKGILIAAMNFAKVPEDEFHDWYDLEHIPERLRVPGFLGAERWIGAENNKVSVATYDLESVGVLHSAPYLTVARDNSSPWTKRLLPRCTRLLRYEGEQILPGDRLAPAAPAALLLVAMNIVPEHEAEFNEWYNSEHIPALASVPGVLCARRYHGSAALQRYVALYHFARTDALDSPAWKKAANTPWTERLRPHFRDFLRIGCRRYERAGS
jgi:hypothetical protein